jgi:hypothetical protein
MRVLAEGFDEIVGSVAVVFDDEQAHRRVLYPGRGEV